MCIHHALHNTTHYHVKACTDHTDRVPDRGAYNVLPNPGQRTLDTITPYRPLLLCGKHVQMIQIQIL